jgi:hypothetical protein
MYRDADEVESFGTETPIPTGRLQAMLVHLGITTTPDTGSRKSRIQGGWNSRLSQRSSLGPGSLLTFHMQLCKRTELSM